MCSTRTRHLLLGGREMFVIGDARWDGDDLEVTLTVCDPFGDESTVDLRWGALEIETALPFE